jgi:hypothetical protein
MVLPFTDTVAILVSLEFAVTVPLPLTVAVTVAVDLGYRSYFYWQFQCLGHGSHSYGCGYGGITGSHAFDSDLAVCIHTGGRNFIIFRSHLISSRTRIIRYFDL